MRILYINYIDNKEQKSGSSVRPVRMLKAFQDLGHEVIVLTGQQFFKERKKTIKAFWDKIKYIEADLCYIESPTYPIIRHADRKLIKKIAKKNIPIGYFYRDFYRKFPDQFERKKGFKGKVKDIGLDILQYLTDRSLKQCNIVYFPTLEASRLFNYTDMRALPPAGENHIQSKKSVNHVGIYVGGVIGPYDSTLLLDSFMVLHQQDPTYRLILVCRKEEWEKVDHPCKNESWLEVHHASGSELIPLYERASIAFVMPDSHFPYNQFAVSVKTYEYISYGIPVIAVNTRALKNIIDKTKIGLAVEPDKVSVSNAVNEILKDDETYVRWQDKVSYALLNGNLWVHRAQQVISDLTAKTNSETE